MPQQEKVLSRKEVQSATSQNEKLKVPVGKMLEGKVAIITGASSGIGKATVETFLYAGARVIGVYCQRADERLYPDAIKDLNGFIDRRDFNEDFIGADINIAERNAPDMIVNKALLHFKKIDLLCNFAGIAHFNNFEKVTREEYNLTLDVNLSGHFFLAQYTAKHMKKNKIFNYGSRGSIINMTSVTGVHVGEDGVSPYAITKSGLMALTKSLATELGHYQIRVNAISPGSIVTPINFRDYKDKSRREQIERRTALGRWGFPQDVANAALFLASDLSAYMTGAELVVDGGMTPKFQLE